MYATVRQYSVGKSVDLDQLARRVRDEFLPQIRKQPGFVDYYMVQSEDGLLLTASIFHDKRGAEHSNEMAAAFVKTMPAGLKLKFIHEGHILVQHREPAPV
jgi:hypothetical protein